MSTDKVTPRTELALKVCSLSIAPTARQLFPEPASLENTSNKPLVQTMTCGELEKSRSSRRQSPSIKGKMVAIAVDSGEGSSRPPQNSSDKMTQYSANQGGPSQGPPLDKDLATSQANEPASGLTMLTSRRHLAAGEEETVHKPEHTALAPHYQIELSGARKSAGDQDPHRPEHSQSYQSLLTSEREPVQTACAKDIDVNTRNDEELAAEQPASNVVHVPHAFEQIEQSGSTEYSADVNPPPRLQSRREGLIGQSRSSNDIPSFPSFCDNLAEGYVFRPPGSDQDLQWRFTHEGTNSKRTSTPKLKRNGDELEFDVYTEASRTLIATPVLFKPAVVPYDAAVPTPASSRRGVLKQTAGSPQFSDLRSKDNPVLITSSSSSRSSCSAGDSSARCVASAGMERVLLSSDESVALYNYHAQFQRTDGMLRMPLSRSLPNIADLNSGPSESHRLSAVDSSAQEEDCERHEEASTSAGNSKLKGTIKQGPESCSEPYMYDEKMIRALRLNPKQWPEARLEAGKQDLALRKELRKRGSSSILFELTENVGRDYVDLEPSSSRSKRRRHAYETNFMKVMDYTVRTNLYSDSWLRFYDDKHQLWQAVKDVSGRTTPSETLWILGLWHAYLGLDHSGTCSTLGYYTFYRALWALRRSNSVFTQQVTGFRMRVLMAAAFWVAAKLVETSDKIPKASQLACMAGVTASCLIDTELVLLKALRWKLARYAVNGRKSIM